MKFISIFKDEFDEFVKYKRSMGYDYKKETVYWYDKLDKYFNDNHLTEKEISEELYNNWWIGYNKLDRKNKDMIK